ncbi:MAG: hypothetical protein HYZ42_00755, partial [Bacteroidetes bacterium]|nr:hypothetical protein [Bacteroidota bacterium]
RMFNHLNELSVYRGLRTSSIDSEIPSPMWLPIILGAFLTIFCAILLDIEHTKMHIGLTSLLGGFIGMFLFTIILLDHPYTGTQRIKPKQYEQIFTIDRWTNEFYHNTPVINK